MWTEQMSQELGFADTLNFINTSANTVNSGTGIDMSKFMRCLYILQAVTVNTSNYSAQLQSSPNSNFNVTHNIAGTNSGNLSTSNQITTYEVRADQVTQANSGDRYVRLSVIGNGNTGVIAVGLGGEADQKPGSQYNLNSTFIAGQFICNT